MSKGQVLTLWSPCRDPHPRDTSVDCSRCGFTLIELLAVVVIVMMLAALVMGLAGYADRASKISRARAELATLASAIEAFRADRGRYPTSTINRFSWVYYSPYNYMFWESYNAAILNDQLSRPKGYLNVGPPTLQLKSNAWTCCVLPSDLHVLTDPWGNPYIYFRTYPAVPQMTTNSCVDTSYATNSGVISTNICSVALWQGGQVNQEKFDLFSLGPDGATYVAQSYHGASTTFSNDDIWYDRSGAVR